MTRIVAGGAGGRRLEVPRSGTRPTSERVREALFSRLEHEGMVDGARVLDLCAGRPALAPGALAALLGRRGEVDLTPREIEVLSVIAAGGTNRTAAERLLVSEATVKTHLLHAYAKLGVSDRAAAVRVAYERGLL